MSSRRISGAVALGPAPTLLSVPAARSEAEQHYGSSACDDLLESCSPWRPSAATCRDSRPEGHWHRGPVSLSGPGASPSPAAAAPLVFPTRLWVCAFSLPPDISERISKNQMNCLHDAADEVAAVFIDHREKYLSSAHRAQTASEPSNGSTEIRPVQMVVDGAHDDGSSA